MNAAKALVEYLIDMVWPLDLMPLYPHPYRVNPVLTSPQYLIPALTVVFILLCCTILMKRQKLWFAVWASYIIRLSPILGFIQVGAQGMADCYTYLPSVWPFLIMEIAAGWADKRIIASVAKKTAGAILTIALCIFTVVLSSTILKQLHIWKDGSTLWSYEFNILGKRSLQDFFVIRTAYSVIGFAHMRNGNYESAIDVFSKAILLKPDAGYHQQRTIAYAKLGKLEEAMRDFTAASSLDPKTAVLYYNRDAAFAKCGSSLAAAADLTKAISLSADINAAVILSKKSFWVGSL